MHMTETTAIYSNTIVEKQKERGREGERGEREREGESLLECNVIYM